MWTAATATQTASAQSKTTTNTTKYWVLFKDKDAGLGKGPVAVEPGFVSERALERRRLRGAASSRTVDAPLSPAYLDVLREIGIRPIVESRWMNGVSVNVTAEQRAKLEKLSFVREVRLVASRVEQQAEPVPTVIASQYGVQDFNFGPSSAQLTVINAIDPIEEGFNGTGVRLGFLDTTTDTLHPALKHLSENGRIVAVRDIPAESGLTQANKHGLNTSSVALGFDEGNLIGACYGAEYLFATTEYAPTETNQEEDFFVAGMEWMERMGADIVNVSLGYSEFDAGQRSYTYADMDGNTAITTVAADRAASLGVVVVTSAGNESCTAGPQNCWYYVTSPADGDSVITAGASDLNFNPVSFSGAGPTADGRIKPDVSAPGLGVFYASSSGGYAGGGGGTSFSSPFVASVACQILQANPTLNPADVRTILRSTASQPANPDNKLGWGVVNAAAAVNLSKTAITGTESQELPSTTPEISIYPNPVSDLSTVSVNVPDNGKGVSVAVYDILGREVVRAEPGRTGDAIHATVDVRNLPAGIYFIHVANSEFDLVKSMTVTH